MSRVVLITGASRGIGAACAAGFAREGDRIAVNYLNSEAKAEALCGELRAMGAEAFAIRADVGDRADVVRMFAAVRERFGEVEVLINNAGISLVKLFTDTTDDDWSRLVSADLSSAFLCCREALPAMIRAHSGCIVNIASMWGEVGASCEAAYSAVKAGIIGMTKALAKEVAPSGIRVNAVSPGVIMTDMMSGFSDDELAALSDEIPLGRFGTPGDVAEAVLFLASDRAGYITGQTLSVNGGLVI